MGAEQGARFATPKPGSKPIINDHPCRCPECQPGPGINYGKQRIEINKIRNRQNFETYRQTLDRLLRDAGITNK